LEFYKLIVKFTQPFLKHAKVFFILKKFLYNFNYFWPYIWKKKKENILYYFLGLFWQKPIFFSKQNYQTRLRGVCQTHT
jgi:hypothetical protein